MNTNSRLLIDMDGVIADWAAEYDAGLDSFGDAAAAIPRHDDLKTFNLFEGRTFEETVIIEQILDLDGFYARLAPIEGAREALAELAGLGHDVLLVSSPWVTNPSCASDKIAWAAKHLGTEWASRTILTTDKTLVHGHLLVDDKPRITGRATPAWKHVLFNQPYNLDLAGPRLTHWGEWELLLDYLKETAH